MMKDLTTGSPMRLILSFGLPTLLGMLFQQFFGPLSIQFSVLFHDCTFFTYFYLFETVFL